MSDLAELLVECDARGIRLAPARDGGLTIDAPRSALTPEVLAWLKAHKTELLAQWPPPAAFQPVLTKKPAAKPVCRCGSTTWRDVPIHNGQSVQRECDHCGRFISFPVWYGKVTGHNGQYPIG